MLIKAIWNKLGLCWFNSAHIAAMRVNPPKSIKQPTPCVANRTLEAVRMLMQARGNLLMWCWKFYSNSLGKEIQMHHQRLSNLELQHSGIKIRRFLLHQTPATRTSYLRLIKFSGGMINISFCHLIGWQRQLSLNIIHRQGWSVPLKKWL